MKRYLVGGVSYDPLVPRSQVQDTSSQIFVRLATTVPLLDVLRVSVDLPTFLSEDLS